MTFPNTGPGDPLAQEKRDWLLRVWPSREVKKDMVTRDCETVKRS